MKPFALQKNDAEDFLDAWSPLGRGEADYCSRDGAMTLKTQIEAYWRERGHTVMINLHNVGFHPAIRAARFDVRSDMINGMPRPARAKPAPIQEVYADADEDFGDEE